MPSPNVKLCLPSAVVTVSSVHVLFASHKLNSEGVPTMRSISILQILVLSDITDVSVLRISQFFLSPRHFPRFTKVLPTLHMFSTTLIYLPRSFSRIPRNRDHGITPMITESRPWPRSWHGIFSPRVVLNALLERICCFCSVFPT